MAGSAGPKESTVRYSLRPIAWAAFVIAVLLLVVIGGIAYRTTNRMVFSERLVSHNREVQQVLEDLRSDSLRASNSRRGFMITREDAMLGGFHAALEDIPEKLNYLRQLTSDNPRSKAEIDELQGLFDRHLSLIKESLALRKSGRPDSARQIQITEQGAEIGEQVNDRLLRLHTQEEKLLRQQKMASQRAYTHTLIALFIGFVGALLLLAVEFFLLNLEFARHEKTGLIAQQSREVVDGFFSSSTVGFAILDSELRYRRINGVLAEMAGLTPETFAGKALEGIFGERLFKGASIFQQVIRTGVPILDEEVSGETPGRPKEIHHWLVNYFPIHDNRGGINQVGIIAVDVTARRDAEDALRGLTARLLTVQDQERRRIARELHDSLGQYLAALKMSLEILANPASQKKEALFVECNSILEKCISETRTLSHLLHPPLLDEAGFASAANWFVHGFSERSGIRVALNLPPDLSRLPEAMEMALFRVLQESLTNVHRHSKATSAEIRLQLSAHAVTLEVTDHGQGIPPAVLSKMQKDGTRVGVGLAGMRERSYELGGKLEIQSDSRGTTVRFIIPFSSGQGQAVAMPAGSPNTKSGSVA
jgi:signal transduction histidine kinase